MPRKPKLNMSGGIRPRLLKDGKTIRYDAIAYVGPKQEKQTFEKKADAQLWRSQHRVRVADGTIRPVKRSTFAEYIEHVWKPDYLATVKKASTRRGYRTIINQYLVPHFGAYQLRAIDDNAVTRFQSKMLATVSARTGRKISGKTVHNALTLLHRIFKNAKKGRFLVVSPMAEFEKLGYDSEPGRCLKPDEVHKLLDAFGNEHVRLITCLGLMAGLRRAEILSLYWTEDRENPDTRSFVDFANNRICIRRNVEFKSRKYDKLGDDEPSWHLVKPKSAAGIRDVPMSADLKYELQQYSWRDGDGLIFSTSTGAPLNPSNVYNRWWRPLVKAAKIGSVGLHDLRHTCGSVWLDNPNVTLQDVMMWLGHSSIQMTVDIYGHPVSNRGPAATAAADAHYDIFQRNKGASA
jgi:integrase